MAISCDPKDLAAAATCFQQCVSAGEVGAIKLYLLRAIAGLSSRSPSDLANDARCFDSCISLGMQMAVENYLLCQIVNNGAQRMCLVFLLGETNNLQWSAFPGATKYLIEESSDGISGWSSDGFFTISDSPLAAPGGGGVFYRITPYNASGPVGSASCAFYTV